MLEDGDLSNQGSALMQGLIPLWDCLAEASLGPFAFFLSLLPCEDRKSKNYCYLSQATIEPAHHTRTQEAQMKYNFCTQNTVHCACSSGRSLSGERRQMRSRSGRLRRGAMLESWDPLWKQFYLPLNVWCQYEQAWIWGTLHNAFLSQFTLAEGVGATHCKLLKLRTTAC